MIDGDGSEQDIHVLTDMMEYVHRFRLAKISRTLFFVK